MNRTSCAPDAPIDSINWKAEKHDDNDVGNIIRPNHILKFTARFYDIRLFLAPSNPCCYCSKYLQACDELLLAPQRVGQMLRSESFEQEVSYCDLFENFEKRAHKFCRSMILDEYTRRTQSTRGCCNVLGWLLSDCGICQYHLLRRVR